MVRSGRYIKPYHQVCFKAEDCHCSLCLITHNRRYIVTPVKVRDLNHEAGHRSRASICCLMRWYFSNVIRTAHRLIRIYGNWGRKLLLTVLFCFFKEINSLSISGAVIHKGPVES